MKSLFHCFCEMLLGNFQNVDSLLADVDHCVVILGAVERLEFMKCALQHCSPTMFAYHPKLISRLQRFRILLCQIREVLHFCKFLNLISAISASESNLIFG
jgi:hypothetical protein